MRLSRRFLLGWIVLFAAQNLHSTEIVFLKLLKEKTTLAMATVADTVSEPVMKPRSALARWFEYDPRLETGERKNFNILPLFVSSPERGTGLGVKFAEEALWEKKDILSAQAVQTVKNKSSYNIKYEFSPDSQGKLPTEISISYENYERFYYGIGNTTNKDDESTYTPELVDVHLPFLYALTSSLNLGLFLDYENWRITQTDNRGILPRDLPQMVGKDGARLFTSGLLLRWDSRDSKTDPSQGIYLEGVYEYSKKLFGSDTDFTRGTLDARIFKSLNGDDRHVLAFRIFGDYKAGDVPFYKLPELGGVFFNRGLIEGRYRDNVALCANLEYRLKIYQRLHWAFFVDAGNVHNSLSAIEYSHVQLTGGTGMRYYVPPGNLLMARIDGGYSTEGFHVYLTFDQPF